MQETTINPDKNCLEIMTLTDKKVVIKEIEFRNGRTYMRAHIRKLRRR